MEIKSIYTLKQPVSHIGESDGTATFLNTVRVMHDGKVEEVFAYTGNAVRGKLRDCAAVDLLEALGVKVKKTEFNILFSGGNISGAMSTDIEQARRYRTLLPIVSLFGAGIGNQILAGKMTQTFALPICRETADILPPIDGAADEWCISWRAMTGTVSFTRMDNGKDVRLNRFLADGEDPKKASGEASTQMRYEVEYMVPGTRLHHAITLQDPTDIEIGCFGAAVEEFAKNPVLGGMGGKGFGLCDLDMRFEDGEWIAILDGEFAASPEMIMRIDRYHDYIKEHRDEIVALLGGEPL